MMSAAWRASRGPRAASFAVLLAATVSDQARFSLPSAGEVEVKRKRRDLFVGT